MHLVLVHVVDLHSARMGLVCPFGHDVFGELLDAVRLNALNVVEIVKLLGDFKDF